MRQSSAPCWLAGADPNAKLNDSETAPSFAVQKGHEAIVTALLAAGADVGDLDWERWKKPKPKQVNAYSKLRTVNVHPSRPFKRSNIPQWLKERLDSELVDFFTERNIEVVIDPADLIVLVDRVYYSASVWSLRGTPITPTRSEIVFAGGARIGSTLRGQLILQHSDRKIKKYKIYFEGSESGPWFCSARTIGKGSYIETKEVYCRKARVRGDIFRDFKRALFFLGLFIRRTPQAPD